MKATRWLTWPGLIIAVGCGLGAQLSLWLGLAVPLPGTQALSDPREVMVLLGGALAGPLGALLTGVLAALGSGAKELLPFGIATQVSTALVAAVLYRPLVARTGRWFLLAWVGVVFFVYFAVNPLLLLGLHALWPHGYSLLLGDAAPAEMLGPMMAHWWPECVFTAAVTTVVLLALPPRLRRPRWGAPLPEPTLTRNRTGSVGLRVALWVALFTLVPLSLQQLGWLHERQLFGAVTVLMLLVMGVVWQLAMRPLRVLSAAIAALTEGQRTARVDLSGMDDELRVLGEAFNGMASAIELSEEDLRRASVELEARVAARTAELADLNRELESFAASASHDLAAPLRAIAGFATAVTEDHGPALGEEGRAQVERIRLAAQRSQSLLDGLLALSRVGRQPLERQDLDVSAMAQELITELREREPQREVEVVIAPGLRLDADRVLLRAALVNLLGNAWKFTAKTPHARVELAALADGKPGFVVRDNGAGFDMTHAAKLAQPFQRLHSISEFPGNGVGLATVRRIAERHGGSLRGEGAVGRGASFTITW